MSKDWKKLWLGFERQKARRKANSGPATLLGVRPCSKCGITSTSWVSGDDYSKGIKFVGDVCEYCIVDEAYIKHNVVRTTEGLVGNVDIDLENNIIELKTKTTLLTLYSYLKEVWCKDEKAIRYIFPIMNPSPNKDGWFNVSWEIKGIENIISHD